MCIVCFLFIINFSITLIIMPYYRRCSTLYANDTDSLIARTMYLSIYLSIYIYIYIYIDKQTYKQTENEGMHWPMKTYS